MNYIATFFSHFGAMRYKKELDSEGIEASMMPVPRFLSSSCGTCVSYSSDAPHMSSHDEELEQIVLLSGPESFSTVFKAYD